jgi:hypothetical protein
LNPGFTYYSQSGEAQYSRDLDAAGNRSVPYSTTRTQRVL